MQTNRKRFACEVRALESEAGGPTRVRVIASTGSQDRHGEFLDPNGPRLVKGAPLLYGHDYSDIEQNIGVVESMTIEDGKVIVEASFDDQIPAHTNAQIAAGKAKRGSLNHVSVGFVPKVVQFKSGEVKRLAPGEWVWGEPGLTYLEWDLAELSFVPVPANPDAELLSARGAGEPGSIAEALLASPQFISRLRDALGKAEPASAGSGDPGQTDPVVAAPAAGEGVPADPEPTTADAPVTHKETEEEDLDELFFGSLPGEELNLDSMFPAAPASAGSPGE